MSKCCVYSNQRGNENGEDQKFGDEVGQEHFKLGYGRRRGRRCRAGVALRATRGGSRRRRRRHYGSPGRQSVPGKAQTEAKACCPHPDEVGGRQISEEKSFGEGASGSKDVHEAEEITSGPLRYTFITYRTPTVTPSSAHCQFDPKRQTHSRGPAARDSRPRRADTPPRCAACREIVERVGVEHDKVRALARFQGAGVSDAQKLGPWRVAQWPASALSPRVHGWRRRPKSRQSHISHGPPRRPDHRCHDAIFELPPA